MDLRVRASIAFTGLTFVISLLSSLVSMGIIVLIVVDHRRTKSVPVLLAGYTSFILFVIGISLASISLLGFCGYLGIQLSDHGDTPWCHWSTFLYRTGLCALFDSYLLQALFRSFRVVLYRHKYLHSFTIYCLGVPLAIIISVLSMAPLVIADEIHYLPSSFYCDISISRLPIFGYFLTRIYIFPLLGIFSIYVLLMRYVRQKKMLAVVHINAQHRLRHNARDLIVLKRFLVTLILLIFLGLPGICFLIYFYATGDCFALVYQLTWFCISIGSILLCYFLVMFTPPLKDTAKKLLQRFPAFFGRVQPMPVRPGHVATTGI